MGNLADLTVLPALGKARWTTAQIFGYEIALEAVRQAIGACARRIAEAEAADEPDQDLIAALRAEQAAWAARGEQLDPLDTRAVSRVRVDADNLLSVDDEDEDDDEGADEQDDDAEEEPGGQDGRGD
ncbi:hypothetical protein [Kribbella sp. NPDC050459]|uniref:hypothetical protein n=1 Tax=Kribbella sp. NPDC050459 TaxID=3155785 RepID=UPI0033F75F44